MFMFTARQLAKLIDNGIAQSKVRGTNRELDFHPVVKLFNPVGAGTWLLTEIEPDEPSIAWGLCDLGMGCAEFGTVDLAELREYRGPLRLGIERDLHWDARGPISAYIDAAREEGRIVQLPMATTTAVSEGRAEQSTNQEE